MIDWLQWVRSEPSVLGWLATISLLMFVGSLVVVPLVVWQIPSDYFSQAKRPLSPWIGQPLAVRVSLVVAKNVAGFVLVAMGIAMLVLPGQGLLAIVAGMMLLNFPGKFQLERWLVRRGPVLRAINALRKQAQRDPLVVDEDSGPPG